MENNMNHRIIVHKYGSSVLPSSAALPSVVDEIKDTVAKGYKVIAIISAFGNTTDQLQNQLKQFSVTCEHAVASYLAVGEIQSASLVALTARQAGVRAALITPQQIELRTIGDCLNSNPIALNPAVIQKHLLENDALILPGFFGVNQNGQTALLGRGGSDLSALFVASAIQADLCQLYKDVDGVYDSDPAVNPQARRYDIISWEDALQLPGRIIQNKTVQLATEHKLLFCVKAIGKSYYTLVGGKTSQLSKHKPRVKKCAS
jgi:aspartate kinase